MQVAFTACKPSSHHLPLDLDLTLTSRVIWTQEGKSKLGEGGIFLLAFTTTLREGIEAVVFLAGVTAGQKVQSVILPCFVGLLMGLAVGVVLYYT